MHMYNIDHECAYHYMVLIWNIHIHMVFHLVLETSSLLLHYTVALNFTWLMHDFSCNLYYIVYTGNVICPTIWDRCWKFHVSSCLQLVQDLWYFMMVVVYKGFIMNPIVHEIPGICPVSYMECIHYIPCVSSTCLFGKSM